MSVGDASSDWRTRCARTKSDPDEEQLSLEIQPIQHSDIVSIGGHTYYGATTSEEGG